MIYTIISKSKLAHHLRGYEYTAQDQAGETQTFYGSEFEELLPNVEPTIGMKFEYELEDEDQVMKLISK